MWVWEHALFNYNPKRPDSTKKDKTVEVITKADHDDALRRAKAEGWREAEKEARREAGNPGNTGDYQLACRYLAEVYNARAAQIEKGEHDDSHTSND